MTMNDGSLVALVALGAFHGLNPGMGWLFAVARGLQERSRALVLQSLPAIAAGHAASVFVIAAVVAVTEARALVEARLPVPDVTSTTDPLVRALLVRGTGAEKLLPDPSAPGALRGTGRLHVDPAQRVVTATGQPQQRVFAAGYWTSGGQVAAFARPRTNAPFFRQNDALARGLWRELSGGIAPALVRPDTAEVAR